MKNVIRAFVATAIMTVLTVSAFAQGAGPKGGAPGQGAGVPGKGGQGKGGPGGQRRSPMGMDAEILAKLNLTADQQKQVKALKEATGKKMEAMRKDFKPGGDREAMRAKFKGVFDGYQDGLKKILTPKQYADYDKAVKEARKKMGAGRPGGPGGAPPAGRAAAGAGKGKGKGGN